mmetsp:Transcript_110520/g.195690  ORF Transcript_110520/g.195690 Transcript_110520/m.195690 type:complete len:82 (-) Transcript_110520:241-486(-)
MSLRIDGVRGVAGVLSSLWDRLLCACVSEALTGGQPAARIELEANAPSLLGVSAGTMPTARSLPRPRDRERDCWRDGDTSS